MLKNTDGLEVSKFSFDLEVVIIDPGSTDRDVLTAFTKYLESVDLPGFFTMKIKEPKRGFDYDE